VDSGAYDLTRALHGATIAGGTPVQLVPDLPESDPLARAWATFKRQVGPLLAAGQRGRFAVVHGDEVAGVWDTLGEAARAGHERFGVAPFLVQEVQPFIRRLRWGYMRVCRD
jgi:hypothetical protein